MQNFYNQNKTSTLGKLTTGAADLAKRSEIQFFRWHWEGFLCEKRIEFGVLP